MQHYTIPLDLAPGTGFATVHNHFVIIIGNKHQTLLQHRPVGDGWWEHNFSKNLRETSKFLADKGWHAVRSIMRTQILDATVQNLVHPWIRIIQHKAQRSEGGLKMSWSHHSWDFLRWCHYIHTALTTFPLAVKIMQYLHTQYHLCGNLDPHRAFKNYLNNGFFLSMCCARTTVEESTDLNDKPAHIM
jgi:hypothetical protein